MNVNEMTDEELGAEINARWRDPVSLATLGKSARELLAPPLRQDVPSVEEIADVMCITDKRNGDTYGSCARVAHAMMQRIATPPATEARTMIQGMTADDIFDWLMVNGSLSRTDTREIANAVYRIANTPADVPDPDAEAKENAFSFHCVASPGMYANEDECWDGQGTKQRVGWRAVAAAAKGSE
jgi:hypothetical protein